MEQLSNIKFSMWTDGKRHMCSITAKVPDKHQGLSYISFYMADAEFASICNYNNAMVSDIGHKLESYGDLLRFYDMEWPAEKSGQMTVRFYSADFPVFARKMLLKIARRVWKYGPQDETRTVLDIDSKRFARWNKLYSVGSGKVELVMDDVTKNYFEERLSEPGNDLRKQVDTLLSIGKNGTYRFWHTGKVRLSKDSDDFYFRIISPNGGPILNGGIVFHRSSKNWSIHT